MHLASDCESCKHDVLTVQGKKEKEESSREGLKDTRKCIRDYKKYKKCKKYKKYKKYKKLSGMVILLVGFTRSLLLNYCEELVLPEAGCPCLCQS